MYLSHIQLRLNHLRPEMLQKWRSATSYASHQWLWQLFPDQENRHFLFRQQEHGRFFMLSATPPLTQHALFSVATKPFRPQLAKGLMLDFQLRANPVITRSKKRSDVMMHAKYLAKASGVAQEKWWEMQQEAAQRWLETQGDQHGFRLLPPDLDDFSRWAGADYADEQADAQARFFCVKSYQQHRFVRKSQEKPIVYSSVDYAGVLCITDTALFEQALFHGLGKCKALGCGMLMVKRKR